MISVTRQDSQALVLDAGHIAVVSKLADKDQIKDVQSKRESQRRTKLLSRSSSSSLQTRSESVLGLRAHRVSILPQISCDTAD
jgi:hypothetical protein